MAFQIANKVMSDSPGLVDFPIRLVKSGFHLTDGQVNCFFLWRLEVGAEGGGGGVRNSILQKSSQTLSKNYLNS